MEATHEEAGTIEVTPAADPVTLYAPRISGRVPSLDGLRAFSILLVLLGHGVSSDGAPASLAVFGHAGNIGVRFFFVISGFLITMLLLKEWKSTGGISLKGFYRRRVLRIFPASYALIAIIGLLGALHKIRLRPHSVLHAATYTMNYFDIGDVWLGQLWSLAVEEQFYLLWPGLLLLAGLRKAFRGAWGVVVGVLVLRYFMWYWWGADPNSMTKHFEAVADSLAWGCLLAAYYNRMGAWRWYMRMQSSAIVFLGLGLGLILVGNGLFVVDEGAFYVWGQSLANVGTVMCIDWAIRHPQHMVGRLLNWKPVMAIGALSYSLYLWQNPFLLGSNGTIWTRFPYNLGFAVAAALLSYFLIERPFLRLKDKGKQRAVAASL